MRAYLRGLRDFYHAFNVDDGPRGPVIEALAAHTSVHDTSTLASIGMHTVDPNAALDVKRSRQLPGDTISRPATSYVRWTSANLSIKRRCPRRVAELGRL